MKRLVQYYHLLTPAEKEKHDNDTFIGFVVRCHLGREAVMDAIDNRMPFLSRESAEYIINFLNTNYYLQHNG